MNKELLMRIDQRLTATGLSDNAACEKAGINRDTIRDLRRGKRQSLTGPTLSKLAAALETTVSWLLAGDDNVVHLADKIPATVDSVNGRQGIPQEGIPQMDVTAGLGGGGVFSQEMVATHNGVSFTAEAVSDWWRLPPTILSRSGISPKHIAAFPCQGDSMYPTINDGDIVFADTRHRVPSPPGVYVLADEFGGVIVKRLEVVSTKNDEQIIVRVASDNPKHLTRDLLLDEIQIIGRYFGKFTTG